MRTGGENLRPPATTWPQKATRKPPRNSDPNHYRRNETRVKRKRGGEFYRLHETPTPMGSRAAPASIAREGVRLKPRTEVGVKGGFRCELNRNRIRRTAIDLGDETGVVRYDAAPSGSDDEGGGFWVLLGVADTTRREVVRDAAKRTMRKVLNSFLARQGSPDLASSARTRRNEEYEKLVAGIGEEGLQ